MNWEPVVLRRRSAAWGVRVPLLLLWSVASVSRLAAGWIYYDERSNGWFGDPFEQNAPCPPDTCCTPGGTGGGSGGAAAALAVVDLAGVPGEAGVPVITISWGGRAERSHRRRRESVAFGRRVREGCRCGT